MQPNLYLRAYLYEYELEPSFGIKIIVIEPGGDGSVGLRAAIEAHDAGAHVLIISKSKKADPHTVLARGGINAALGAMDPEDNWG
jgi:succinate dehydrogenase/fumarate reductase flavoprotein subunit